jgi:hypothetical protein
MYKCDFNKKRPNIAKLLNKYLIHRLYIDFDIITNDNHMLTGGMSNFTNLWVSPKMIKGIHIGKVFFCCRQLAIELTTDLVCMGRKSCQYNLSPVLK